MEANKNKNSYQLFNHLKFSAFYDQISRPIIISDNLRTPENIGAVLRIAANIGAEKVFFISDDAKQFKDHRIFRTASGAADKLQWKSISMEDLSLLIPAEYRLIALETVRESTNIYNFSFTEKVAFLIGNEVNGINDKLLQLANDSIYIPVPGSISSLNVSHALAVAAFEWLRQMTLKF